MFQHNIKHLKRFPNEQSVQTIKRSNVQTFKAFSKRAVTIKHSNAPTFKHLKRFPNER
jgi:hypothetical protein